MNYFLGRAVSHNRNVEFPPEEHSSYRVMFDVIAKNQNRKKNHNINTENREKKIYHWLTMSSVS